MFRPQAGSALARLSRSGWSAVVICATNPERTGRPGVDLEVVR